MASQASNSSSTLLRYRPAVIAVLAIAVGCTGYYLHNSLSTSFTSNESANKARLHRSNAVRRSRQLRPINTQTPSQEDHCPLSPTSLRSSFLYGNFWATDLNGVAIKLPLVNGDLLSAPDIARRYGVRYTLAVRIRQDLEAAFLDAFFARTMPTGSILQLSKAARQHIVDSLGTLNNISPDNISNALDRYCNGELEDHPNRVERQEHERKAEQQPEQDRPRNESEAVGQHPRADETPSSPAFTEQDSRPLVDSQSAGEDDVMTIDLSGGVTDPINPDGPAHAPRSPAETVMERSEHSWRGQTEDHSEHTKQTVLGLIYHIAEEQARKEGYVHRGVTCNGCGSLPIRGIRYRCTNCADYDLCELCEAQQIHDRTHLFYKVRIPAPFLGNPRQPQPVWYPGKPRSNEFPMHKDDKALLCQRTGLQMPVLEALWEQFKCLAAVDYPEDPTKYYLAIDRPTFDKCFIPKSSIRPPPPNLIYDRIFAFYDTNDDSLIGFQEFVFGISSIGYKKPQERLRQIFNGYDIDNDGFVSRLDFQRMFKALFSLHRELAKDIVTRLDDEFYDEEIAREVVNSSQALSSAFSGSIPPGDPSRAVEGKSINDYGDYVITNDSIETVKPEDDFLKNWPDQQDYGQEILYHVIHDSINELLDPLFKFRENIGLAVIRSRAERQENLDKLAQLRKAGFWIILEVLINRFEQKWRVKSGDTLVDDEAQLLIEYVTGMHIYQTYDPSEEYCEKRERHTTEQFAPFIAAELITRDGLAPAETLAEVRSQKQLMASLQEQLEDTTRQQFRESVDESEDNEDDVRDALNELRSPPISPSIDVKKILGQRQDEDIPPLPEDLNNQSPSPDAPSSKASSASASTTSISASLDKPLMYEFSDTERPTDPTLPQNFPGHSPPDGEKPRPPGMDRLKYLSLMDLLERRDGDRGGPGRIHWSEFEEIMKGPKGHELGFLAAWIDMATF